MHGAIAQSFNDRISDLYKHAGTVATLESEMAFNVKSSSETEVLLEKSIKANADSKIINSLKFLKEYQEMRESLYAVAKEDAVVNLALRKTITLVGPEDKNLVDQTLGIAQKDPLIEVDDPRLKVLAHKRELHVVSKVAESRDSIIIGVFGGSHDFSEEIASWNKNNPNKQIALVEIMPKEYEINFGKE